MRRPTGSLLALAIAGAGLLTARPQAAANDAVVVAPTTVIVDERGSGASVRLENASTRPRRFQMSVHAWTNDADGVMRLAPTDEVVAAPALFVLGPGESRRVRLALRPQSGPREHAYRLIIDELADESETTAGSGVTMLTRLNLPVFQKPAQARGALEVAGVEAAAGRLRATVTNAGQAHLRPHRVTVHALDEAGRTLHQADFDGWYLLAGEARAFDLPLTAAACAAVRRIRVEADFGDAPPWQGLRSVDDRERARCVS